ncbi:uncharacterized protein LOC118745643 isoform X1 [Rhagoletis pomonella]|uniref:uncharacterized protein LOC118745643 isoform X1 n=1 Tax=Rhagoletis pomonella TaxID=28610 RepID=UPI00177CE00D|nr:uncharacterized protein LOC118745643 isoform X1 [Rhagoletis pomonella]
MPDSDKCKGAIRGETLFRCEGVCGRAYHSETKCSGIDSFKATVIGTHPIVKFICVECVTYIHNVDLVIRDIQENVHKNNTYFREYKSEFEEALKTNQMEMKQLLVEMEKRYNERIEALRAQYEEFSKKAVEVTKVREAAEQLRKQTEAIGKENVKFCNEMRKMVKENNNDIRQQMSYANAVKLNKQATKEVPEITKRTPIIVKPKTKQNSETTKMDLNSKINPEDIQYQNW